MTIPIDRRKSWMTNQKYLIETLKKLAQERVKKEVYALPTRPRHLATDALNSDEITHLAKHLIKVTLWPNSSYCKGWFKEIKTSLDNLVFKLCRHCIRKNDERIVKELWYDHRNVMKKLNDKLDDAYWKVIEEMKPMLDEIKDDPFQEEGNDFSKIGYTLEEEKTENGSIQFQIKLKGKTFI
jgi:hypothetical protein